MTDVTKGAVVGIGSGVKSHITTIYTQGEKTFVNESYCGSVKTSGWSKSRTYATDIVSEESFYLAEIPTYTKGSETYEQDFQAFLTALRANGQAHLQAMVSMRDQFLALDNSCSKCAKWLKGLPA